MHFTAFLVRSPTFPTSLLSRLSLTMAADDEEYLRAEGAANQRAADAAKRAKETAAASKEQLEQKVNELQKEIDKLKSW